MIDHDEDKIDRLLRYLLNRRKQGAGRRDCRDEESLASYLTGVLTSEGREQVEAHLAECSFCIEDLVAAHNALGAGLEETVPQTLAERAMALVPSSEQGHMFLDLVVRMVQDSLELVGTSGHSTLAPARVGIRGRAKSVGASILRVEKELGSLKVAVEVEHTEPEFCQVGVKVKQQGGGPAEGIRVSLISHDREQASYLARQGEIVFDRIPQGEYNLAVFVSGSPAGTIRLKLTG